jgi:hypothetical protein
MRRLDRVIDPQLVALIALAIVIVVALIFALKA